MSPQPSERILFHAAEFNTLKSEVSELIKSANANLQYGLIASAGIVSWLVTKPLSGNGRGETALHIGSWLPIVVSGTFALLSFAAARRIKVIGSYLSRLENELAFSGFGWESYLRTQFPSFELLHWCAWLALLVADGVAAWLLHA